MLDIKYIRENPDQVKRGIANKYETDRIDELLNLDAKRRELITNVRINHQSKDA